MCRADYARIKHTAGLQRETAACLAILWQTTWERASIFFLAGLGKTKSAHFRCIKFVSDFISETTLGWFFRSLKLPTFSWKKRSNQTMGPSSGRSNFLGLISSYHTRSYIRHGQAKTWRVRVLYDSAISNPGNDQCLCWFFLKFLYIFYSAFIT